ATSPARGGGSGGVQGDGFRVRAWIGLSADDGALALKAWCEDPPPREGERLCWGSSCFPWFAVPEHGVEDGDEFAHGSYQRDEFGLAGSDQPIAKFLELRVVSDGAEGGHEEARSHPA